MRAGAHRHMFSQMGDGMGRQILEFKRHHIAGIGKGSQLGEVVIGAHRGVWRHLEGGRIGRVIVDAGLQPQTRGGHCHSAGGAENSGGLDFSVSTDVMYAELVGDGGSLAHANNSDGDDHTIFRVVPGDAGASFLYLKLVTQSGTDPHYGAGLPFDYPGQLCPADIEAVKTWIDDGAPFVAIDAGTGGNEDAGPADAGSDSGADAGDGG